MGPPAEAAVAATRSRNGFLRALPDLVYAHISSALEPISIASGTVLFTRDAASAWVYIPVSGIVSLTVPLQDGRSVQAAVVGREGVAGIHAGFDSPLSLFDGSVLLDLRGYRVAADMFRTCTSADEECRRLMNRYIRAFTAQIAQTAACNATHSLRERVCATLLAILDRVDGDRFTLTQEGLAAMLAVRRQGVNQAAQTLQEEGLLDYRRGRVAVRDRLGLERCACECYGVERAHLGQFFE